MHMWASVCGFTQGSAHSGEKQVLDTLEMKLEEGLWISSCEYWETNGPLQEQQLFSITGSSVYPSNVFM